MSAKTQRPAECPSDRTHGGAPPRTPTRPASGRARAVLGCGVSRSFVGAAWAPHTTRQSHPQPQAATTRNVSRCDSTTTEDSPPAENLRARERLTHLRCFRRRVPKRRDDTSESAGDPPYAGQPLWSAAAMPEASPSGDARPPCSVKASPLPCTAGLLVPDPPALSQHHPPPQRALSAQGTRLSCLQALLTGSPLSAPRSRPCHVHTQLLARP